MQVALAVLEDYGLSAISLELAWDSENDTYVTDFIKQVKEIYEDGLGEIREFDIDAAGNEEISAELKKALNREVRDAYY